MATASEVSRRIKARLNALCFCGHPKWMHSMDRPHPCSHCTGCAQYDGKERD